MQWNSTIYILCNPIENWGDQKSSPVDYRPTSTTMVVGEAQEQNIIFEKLKKKKGRDSSGYLK